MDVSAVKKQIQTKKLDSMYMFTGPEWAVQKIYIQQIAKCAKLELRYVDTIADIYNSLKRRSFVDKSYCYVIMDDKELISNESLLSSLPSLLADNILILILTQIDKRTKFYKAHKDDLVEFEFLKPAVLKKYIQKEIDLSDAKCEELMAICEYDYGRCLLEIDKIKRFHKHYESVPNNLADENGSFRILVDDGVIYKPPKDAIFDFVNAVLDRDVEYAFDYLQQSYESGEATLVLLSVWYNNAKAVLQIQECGNKDIGKSTGLSGWQIKNAMPHKGKYSSEELVYMLQLLRQLETGIKIGRYDEQYAMEYALVNLM